MGMRVWPNALNVSCESQTSSTCILAPVPKHTWERRPAGAPAPAVFRRLITSSYCSAVIEGGVNRMASAMVLLLPDLHCLVPWEFLLWLLCLSFDPACS